MEQLTDYQKSELRVKALDASFKINTPKYDIDMAGKPTGIFVPPTELEVLKTAQYFYKWLTEGESNERR